ncbi:MAG: 50S ribosomal protein L21 [Planctomycetota bacterium]
MYAVIRDGSHQHIVRPGDVVNLAHRELPEGVSLDLGEVLLLADDEEVQVGTPVVANVKVRGTVAGEAKGEKLVVFKYKRRKDSRTKKGHRQKFTVVRIDEIVRS